MVSIVPQQEGLLTVGEVAEFLHIHPNTVRRWNDRGILPAYHICRRGDRRFRPIDIALFLTQGGLSCSHK